MDEDHARGHGAVMSWSTWLTSPVAWLGRVTGWSAPPKAIEDVRVGADYHPDIAVSASYDPHDALSMMAAFPWVRACLDAIGGDLAGLPLIAYRGRGSDAVRLHEHPALSLLDQPTTDMARELWERQLIVYLLLTGNAYGLLVGGARPVSVPLIHPERCKPTPTPYGGIEGYVVGLDQSARYPADAVLHWRLPSWSSDPESLLGEGLARALHDDLTADRAASRLTAAQAQRGRPNAILSPSDPGDQWSPEARKELLAEYVRQTASGGPIAVGRGLKIDLPTYTPQEMELGDLRQLARTTVLATFGVPPVRVGLETANYATAQQQARVYWEGLVGLARLLDGQLTRIARRWDPAVRIAHDFAGVDALQESRTDRLGRVATWVTLGASAADAAAYEGLDDAPVSAEPQEEPSEPAPTRSLSLLFGEVRAEPPTSEADRAALWRARIAAVHTPAETRLARVLGAALSAQRARVIARLTALETRGKWPTGPSLGAEVERDLVSDILGWLWPSEEDRALAEAADAMMVRALRDAFEAAAAEVGEVLAYDEAAQRAALSAGVDLLTGPVSRTTRTAVQAAIALELSRGGTIADMQRALQTLPAFSPARALMVARTETTRAVGAASEDAYTAAIVVAGVSVEKQWLSARDSEVRDAHILLDGQTRRVGEPFVVPAGSPVGAGESAQHPGGFSRAALTVNCRCTTIPIVRRDAA